MFYDHQVQYRNLHFQVWAQSPVTDLHKCYLLTESKLPNVWYQESFDWLCKYTPRGFAQEKLAFKGSKKILFERGFER